MKGKRVQNKSKRGSIVLIALMILFAGVAVYAGYQIISVVSRENREQAAFDDLNKLVEETQTEMEKTAESSDSETDLETYSPYKRLYDLNEDYLAWLKIDGTHVNYPVMYTPEDPEFYLRRGFDKEYAHSGTPFIGEGYTLDTNYCIIYGHNMRNKTMFADLEKYRDYHFWEEHPTFNIYTLNETRNYEIIATVETRILNIGEEGFEYYYFPALPTEEQFEEFREWIEDNRQYDTGVNFDGDDLIVALSTCDYEVNNGRFVLFAKWVKDSD